MTLTNIIRGIRILIGIFIYVQFITNYHNYTVFLDSLKHPIELLIITEALLMIPKRKEK